MKQLKNTFGLIRDTIAGVDFYFRDLETPFSWGYRFGRSYWETPNDEQPSQADLLAYLDELEGRVAACFGAMQDEELDEIYDAAAETPIQGFALHLRLAPYSSPPGDVGGPGGHPGGAVRGLG